MAMNKRSEEVMARTRSEFMQLPKKTLTSEEWQKFKRYMRDADAKLESVSSVMREE